MTDNLDVVKSLVQANKEAINNHTEDLHSIRDTMVGIAKTQAIIETRLVSVEATVSKFSGGINRGLWLIGGGFITTLIAWVSDGVFHR